MRLSTTTGAATALLIVAAAALLSSAIALWETRGGIPLTPDAAEYTEVARSLVRGQGFTIHHVAMHPGLLASIRNAPELHGLLEPLLIAPFFVVLGVHAALARVPGAILLGGAAVLAFWTMRRAFNVIAGLLAAAYVLTSAGAWYLALLAADDLPFAVFSVASIFFLWNAFEEERLLWFALAGIAAGMATLGKFTGCVFIAAAWAALLSRRRDRRPPPAAAWIWTAAPVLFAASLYLLRNYLVHGGLGFRFTAIDWLSRRTPRAYFAFYDHAPRSSDVWSELGWSGVSAIVTRQLGELFTSVLANWGVFLGGAFSLIMLRKRRELVVAVTVYTLGTFFVLCVPYHPEARYLSGVIGVFALCICAGLGCFLGGVTEPSHDRPRLGAYAVCVLVAFSVVAQARSALAAIRTIAIAGRSEGVCSDAIRFLRRTTTRRDAILTTNPWLVSWEAERAAINAPTNGPEAVAKVARHYGTDWALIGASTIWAASPEELLADLTTTSPDSARATLVYDGAVCDVYALSPPPSRHATVARPGW